MADCLVVQKVVCSGARTAARKVGQMAVATVVHLAEWRAL